MKKLPYALLFFLLAGCTPSSSGGHGTNLETNLQNPLYAERYWEALTDRMVELEIRKDPILEDERKKNIADDTRLNALKNSQDSRKLQRQGINGFLIQVGEFAEGEVLYLDGTLYLSSTFDTDPGPSLHIYLTTVTDPRDVEFPDKTSVDLGRLESPFGAQHYDVPAVDQADQLRTAVLFDTELERIHGFAQLKQ